MSGLGDTFAPSMGDDSIFVDYGHLAHIAVRITFDKSVQCLGRSLPQFHHFQPKRTVGKIYQRLSRHRPDTWFQPDDIGHLRPVRLHRCPELTGGTVITDYGISVYRVKWSECRTLIGLTKPCQQQDCKNQDWNSHDFPLRGFFCFSRVFCFD